MGVSKEEARVLGLTKNEQVLLRVIEDGPFRISQLTYLSDLPRMTVYSVLGALMMRGFVIKERFGRYWRYKLANIPNISTLQESRSDQKTDYQDVSSIVKLYEKMFRLHAFERIQVIQSAQSWKRCLKKIPLKLLNDLNAGIKKNRVILEAIVSSSVAEMSKSQMNSWKRNMEGRTTGVTLVSDEALNFDAEVWIFSDAVLITDWKEETCEVIKGEGSARLFGTLFSSFQGLGKRFDSNAFLRAHM